MACISVETVYSGEITPTMSVSDLSPAEYDGFAFVFADELAILADEGLDPDRVFGLARCTFEPEISTLIIFAQSAPFCGDTCGFWGIEAGQSGDWQRMLAGEGHLRLTESQSMGRPDLIAEVPGYAAIVHKYDGSFYRDVLDGLIYGELYTPPSADGWQADEVGFVGIVPDSGTTARYAIEHIAQIEDIAPNVLEAGLTDLNGDDFPDVIITATTSPACGPDGCRFWIVTGGAAPDILGHAVSQGLPEIAFQPDHSPWRDIIAWGASGAQVLRFDGAQYR